MIALVAIVFSLVWTGSYLLLLGGRVRVILAFLFLGNAANLMVFRFSGPIKKAVPIIADGEKILMPPYSDPLPQALVLTAIVIGLGMTLFLGSLAVAAFRESKAEVHSE